MNTEKVLADGVFKPQFLVKTFWEGLAEGHIYGRKCKECGAIEFPPHLCCNTCGTMETEWVELSGKGWLKSFVFTGILNARMELEDLNEKYVCGEVQLDEGPAINAVIMNVKRKKAREIETKLPVRVKPLFYNKLQDGEYTTLYFELDEDEE